jgi:hypothetical protein
LPAFVESGRHGYADWLEEFWLYHRKYGRIVDERDDLMSATRHAHMMLRLARTKPQPTIRRPTDIGMIYVRLANAVPGSRLNLGKFGFFGEAKDGQTAKWAKWHLKGPVNGNNRCTRTRQGLHAGKGGLFSLPPIER